MSGPPGACASSGGPVSGVRRRATLPRPVGRSTIAVPGLSFRVRNGCRASLLGHDRRKSSIRRPRPWGVGMVPVMGRGPDSGRDCRYWFHGHPDAPCCPEVQAQYDVRTPNPMGWGVCCRSPVSTGQLHPLRGFHVRPIHHVFSMGGTGSRGIHGMLISEQASRLDAFSGYPSRT